MQISRHLVRMLVGLVACTALVAGCGGGSDSADRPSTSPASDKAGAAAPTPVIDQNFPDPDVLHVGDTYYAYATQSQDNSTNIQMATSKDLKTWTVADTDPLPKLPAWATNGRTWAPDVSAAGKGFVMYFTARSVEPDLQCIGVARSTKPDGPFTPVGGRPLVCPAKDGGAIDPASYVEPNGSRYLLWKNDGNCCGKDTWLHLQAMSADGLATAGPARRLVKQDKPWEGQLVEAPTLVRHGTSYVLFYSANDYGGEKYTTGYATAPKLTGPYTKADGPLLTTDNTRVTGPGGQDVLTEPSGTSYIVFHGWDPAVIYRGMYVEKLTWKGDVPVPQPAS
jgi:arabinan endo-1,5-alpha-L-arabinosidase